MSFVRSCLARIGCLTVIVVLAGAAWIWRGPLLAWWQHRDRPAVAAVPSPDLARTSGRKLDAFLEGRGPARISFDQAELQSLASYRFQDSLPPGLADPRITIGDSTLEASAAIQVERLMRGKAPEGLRSLLGDSARVSAQLRPSVERPGVLVLGVHDVTAGGLPIPDLMVPWLLQQTGLSNGHGPARAVEVIVPRGLSAVRVEGGRLELERGPPR